MVSHSPDHPTASRGFHLLLPISCFFLILSGAALMGLLLAHTREGVVQGGIVFLSNAGFGLILFISWYREHRRLGYLAGVARSLNLTFVDRVYLDALDPFAALPLFRLTAGYNIQQTGWMEGVFNDQPLILLEYHYGGSFQSGGLWPVYLAGQHLIVILPRASPLPEFVLCPRDSFWNRDDLAPLATLHAGPLVPLEPGPFAKHYILRGMNASALRQLFQPHLQGWFSDEPGWTVESAHGKLLVYHEGDRANPELCSRLLYKALLIHSTLSQKPPEAAPGTADPEGIHGVPEHLPDALQLDPPA
jgi:hypothetical protein